MCKDRTLTPYGNRFVCMHRARVTKFCDKEEVCPVSVNAADSKTAMKSAAPTA